MVSLVCDWNTNTEMFPVAISKDGGRVAAGCGFDVMLLNTRTGNPILGPLRRRKSKVWSLAFSPADETLLACGFGDGALQVWDLRADHEDVLFLEGHTDRVSSTNYTPNGSFLISGSWDGTIRSWDVRTARPMGRPIKTGSLVSSVSISSDGTKIAVGCSDWSIKVYNATTGNHLFQCVGHRRSVRSVSFSPDDSLIASGSFDQTVCIWNAETGQLVRNPLEGHIDQVQAVAFSADGSYVVSTSSDFTARIWHIGTGELESCYTLDHDHRIMTVISVSGGSFVTWMSEDPRDEIEITSTTSIQDIVSHLSNWGCKDMSDLLDWTTVGDYPSLQGGLGDIYRCQLNNGQEVAIKLLRVYDSLAEQTQKVLKHAAREVYTWSKLRHPNVLPLLGLVVFRRQIGMVATWELNGNLSTYLKRHQGADRCELGGQIARGLNYLHHTGVIHGDLKGANILVSRDGVAQLADFGNTVLSEYTLQFSNSSTKVNMSLRWAAPELFMGGRCSREADIYALGMTIMETVTGEVPWARENDITVQFAVAINRLRPNRPIEHIPISSEHGDALWLLLNACWEFEPESRPSADMVENAMKGITQAGLADKKRI